MNITRLGRRLVFAGVLIVAGCEKTDTDVFDGSYRGDAVDSQSATNIKEFTLELSASGSTVSGSYTLRAPILNVSGSLSGTLNGSDLTLTLTPSAPSSDCPYRITGRWGAGLITGSYAAFNCFVRSDGTLSLRKR
jgi:hypothetical protein